MRVLEKEKNLWNSVEFKWNAKIPIQENTFENGGDLYKKTIKYCFHTREIKNEGKKQEEPQARTNFGLAAKECIVLWTEGMQTYICYWQNMYTIQASVHTTSIYTTWHKTYGRWLTGEGGLSGLFAS